VLLAVAVAACSEEPTSTPAQPAPAPTVTPPVPPPRPKPDALVTVIDGDTGKRVRGARVRVGRNVGRADRRGLAAVPLTRRGSLSVHLSALRYVPRRLLLRFQERRRYTLRLYRRAVQWPTYGGSNARNQVHPGIKLRPPFRVVWSRGLGGLIEFPAVVWQGVAYANNMWGTMYALSMRDGRVLWRSRIGTRVAASPTVVPERKELVTATMSPGEVVVLDLRTGRVKWRYRIGRAEPTPVVRGGVAYVAGALGNVIALDLAKRRPRWVHRVGVKITGSPALVGNRLYVGDYAGRVLALDARTGRRIWTGSAGSRVYGTVAVAGGRVFAPSVFSGLSALDARSGRLLWRIPVGVYLYSSPAAFRGRVYFGTYAGSVYAADARTGRVLWSRGAGGAVSGAVQVVAGVVYAGSFGARITAWDWRTGRELWRFPHGEYVPVSGNGGRLLMHGYSRVWAVVPKRKR